MFSYVTEEKTNYDQPAFSNDEKSKLINNFIKIIGCGGCKSTDKNM